MRVLALSTVFPNARTPTAGVFVRERVRHLAALCPLQVVAPIPWFPLQAWIPGRVSPPAWEEQLGLTVHHPRVLSLPGIGKSLDGGFYALGLLPFLARLRQRFPFDVIDAHFAYPDGFGAALLGAALGCPVAITLRGYEVELAARALRRPQLRFALRRAAAVVAVSESMRGLAADLGVPRQRVRVIPNAVDATRFHPLPRSAARARLGLPPDRTILLSVAAFVERKGHERVLEALVEIRARRPDVLYVAVGNHGGRASRLEALRRRAQALDLESHVRFEVARPHDEIPLWMAAADLFCLASRREGWCNALTEALACGLPAVCTEIGANAEVVRHGEDGFLVPPLEPGLFAAAVVRALEHDWDRGAIAQRGARAWDEVAAAALEELERASRTPPVREARR